MGTVSQVWEQAVGEDVCLCCEGCREVEEVCERVDLEERRIGGVA